MNEANKDSLSKGALMTRALNTVWDGVVIGGTKWNPDRTCYQLANEYRRSGRTVEECVHNFIY